MALALLMALAAHVPASEPATVSTLSAQVAAAWDSARGGFVGKDGSPSEEAVELAFALGRREQQRSKPEMAKSPWIERGLATVTWTRGLWDTSGSGFYRRLRDAHPSRVSFDKPTAISARRLDNLIDAWQVTGEVRFRNDAARVVNHFDRILLDGRGGFVAAPIGDRDLVPAVNGPALRGWLRWGELNRESRFRSFALRSIDRIWAICWVPEFGLLVRRDPFGSITEPPRLDDQAEFGRLLLASGRAKDLDRARMLGDVMLERFEDREHGGFRTQWQPKKDGTVKAAARLMDENARAALFLGELSRALRVSTYADAAVRAFKAFEDDLAKSGLDVAPWALAARVLPSGSSELAVQPTAPKRRR